MYACTHCTVHSWYIYSGPYIPYGRKIFCLFSFQTYFYILCSIGYFSVYSSLYFLATIKTTTPATTRQATTIKTEARVTVADVTSKKLIESENVNDHETTVIAIILLVLGVSLTIGLFIFLIFNSKSANRRFKWPNFKYKNKNNVPTDAEADYLMNGMSL